MFYKMVELPYFAWNSTRHLEPLTRLEGVFVNEATPHGIDRIIMIGPIKLRGKRAFKR